MTKAENAVTTTAEGAPITTAAAPRRGVLAGLLALPAVAGAVALGGAAGADPDAPLLSLAAELRAAEAAELEACRGSDAVAYGGDDAAIAAAEAAVDAASDKTIALVQRMAETPAAGLLGLAIKAARVPRIVSDGASVADEALVESLAADAARLLPHAPLPLPAAPPGGDQRSPEVRTPDIGKPTLPAGLGPDAELIAACNRMVAVHAEMRALEQPFDDAGEDIPPAVYNHEARVLVPQIHALRREIGEAAATTQAGLMAKIMAIMADWPDEECVCSENLPAWSLARDLLALNGGAA